MPSRLAPPRRPPPTAAAPERRPAEEKREAEGAVQDLQEQLELEGDEGKRAELAAELAARQGKLDEMMDKFAVSLPSLTAV